MSTLSRWSPFKSLSRIDPMADIDNLFRGLGMRSLMRDAESVPDIRVDVREDDKSYRIKADIPGVKKEDISVSVDGGQVTISAEVKREKESKDEREVCSERYYGNAFRAFTLPVEVDDKKAEAKYDDGVLTLTLPKMPNGKVHRVAIS